MTRIGDCLFLAREKRQQSNITCIPNYAKMFIIFFIQFSNKMQVKYVYKLYFLNKRIN